MDKKVVKKELKEWSKSIIVSLMIVIPIILFAAPTWVNGKSMENGLKNNDILFTEKVTSITSKFSRGEIIVFDASPIDNKNYIKRIIGIPNDVVEIREGHVYVNGTLLNEDYLKEKTYTSGDLKVIVPEEKLFVLGDNREVSQDSRIIGCINMDKVKGHAYYRVYPFSKMGKIK